MGNFLGGYEMKIKCAIFAVLVAFLVLIINPGSVADPIDEVRNKGVLDAEDFKIIDDFIAQKIQELVRTRDFTSIAKVRTVILTRQRSTQAQQAQYAQKFTESARKHIADGFKQADAFGVRSVKPQ